MLAVASAGDADVGLARFAGAVDDAAQYRERHRGLDVAERLFERLDGADDVEPLPRAAGAGDDADAAGAQPERFQDFVDDAHFLFGPGPERKPNRVATATPATVRSAERRVGEK